MPPEGPPETPPEDPVKSAAGGKKYDTFYTKKKEISAKCDPGFDHETGTLDSLSQVIQILWKCTRIIDIPSPFGSLSLVLQCVVTVNTRVARSSTPPVK